MNLARSISALAREQGVAARPAALTLCDIALDTADPARIAPFWAALLTGDATAVTGDEVQLPDGGVLWFQHSAPGETPQQRFHLDVWVPPEVAADRIQSALDAGGRMKDDSRAPSFVVLADPDGDHACVCTSQGR